MGKKFLLALILITTGTVLISLSYHGFSPHPAHDVNSVADPKKHHRASDLQRPSSQSSRSRPYKEGHNAAQSADQNDAGSLLGPPLNREIYRHSAPLSPDQKDVDIISGRSPSRRGNGHAASQGPGRSGVDISQGPSLNGAISRDPAAAPSQDKKDVVITLERPRDSQHTAVLGSDHKVSDMSLRKRPLRHHHGGHAGVQTPDQKEDVDISLERQLDFPPAAGRNVIPFSSSTSLSSSSSVQEVRHLFFLKVHKAASTTVLNVVYRFALSRGLVVLLPTPDMSNILSEKSYAWPLHADPLPPGASQFDVLCNHLIFEETSIRRAMPGDTVFVGIVRDPFRQFVSAFRYYSTVYATQYLTDIPGEDPISTYLLNPEWWEPRDAQLSYTNNRMSVDFGMDPFKLKDPGYARDYVEIYLDRVFHLVMVSDRFDESILLMRRMLGWRIEDVVYVSNNVRGGSGEGGGRQFPRKTFTAREKRAHEAFNVADYTLYRHFAKVFDDKVREAGKDFAREVRAFKTIIKTVSGYCLSNNNSNINHNNSSKKGSNNNKTDESMSLMVRATLWNETFWVTRDDCRFLLIDEITFLQVVRLANAHRRN